MKKYLSIVIPFVLFLLGTGANVSAQCPGCVVNSATCNPPGGGICPDSVPAATVGLAYDEDVTFYLPPEVNTPFGMRPLLQIKIDAITGLPFGINWQSNSANNTYVLNGQGGHGCVKLCGTPVGTPGVYNITITVTALVAVGGILGNQTGQQTFNLQMMLLPNTAGNSAYNFTPGSSCDFGTFNFTPNISATLPMMVTYQWDFGNSQTYSGANPPPMIYSVPGNYPVTATVSYYELRLTDLSVSLTPGVDCWFAGDIEELSCSNGNVDFFFTYNSGTFNYTSSTVSNSPSASWSNLNLPINNNVFSFTIWDDDNGPPFGSPDDNGGTYTGSLTAPGTFNFNTTAVSSGGGGTSGTYTITPVFVNSFTITDTIKVYASPAQPNVSVSANSMCKGDSVLLSTNSIGYVYEWYVNGMLIPNSNFQQLYTKDTGNYFVKVIDPASGCFNTSQTIPVSFYPSVPSNFAIILNSSNGNLQSNLSGSYSYQWQILTGSNWVNIPAPAGVQSFYTPTGNGTFRLIATTPNGCKDTTNAFVFNTFSVYDPEVSTSFSYFPNPTQNLLNINLQLEDNSNVKVIIRDLLGKELIVEDWGVQYGIINQQIDLSVLPSGTYILDVELSNGTIRKKLIKH